MKLFFGLLMMLTISILIAFPIDNYDYRNPIKNISPVTSGMGALNVTSTANDPFFFYGNPALLAGNKSSYLGLSYQIEHKNNNFFDNISASTLLKKNHFLAIDIIQQTGGMLLLPLSDINDDNTYKIEEVTYNEKLNYSLTAYQVSFGTMEQQWGLGMSFKYLNGELVYLKQRKSDNNWIIEEFINDDAKGFSTDIGITKFFSNVKFGLSFYDIWSKLYWKNHPNRILKRRFAFGTAIESKTSNITIGVSGKLGKNVDQIYHCGYSYKLYLSDPMILNQSVDLRIGAFSKNFKNQEDIYISIGFGYYFRNFKIDVSMTDNDLLIENNIYKMSISLGI